VDCDVSGFRDAHRECSKSVAPALVAGLRRGIHAQHTGHKAPGYRKIGVFEHSRISSGAAATPDHRRDARASGPAKSRNITPSPFVVSGVSCFVTKPFCLALILGYTLDDATQLLTSSAVM